MATGDVKRKLTAIFSADVEGYSRLMEEDELATVETLTSHKQTMGKLIRQYRGRVVDSTGDNLLAEFGSVVDAVQCAVEVQQVLSAKNETLPENRRMYFRIGINSGDVIEEGENIYGDGVNVAARVESLAEGGGISISGTAYDQLGKKLPLGYEYLGEQSVKNIEKPVRVYRVLAETEAAGKVIGEKKLKQIPWRWPALAAAIVILVAGVLAVWNFYLRRDVEPASVEKMAFPLPHKPSIAVLAFANISGDPEQEYFSDGLTEEIITALSKMPQIFVIARNSTFSYKGEAVKVKQVAEELGVRYVLEGSVRKAQGRVRITAQLIDAVTGRHLWAERYDKDLKEIFDLQDEITMKIITELQVKLTDGEEARSAAKGTRNLQAYLKYLRAMEHFRTQTKEDNALARRLLEEVIALDPSFAPAYVILSGTYWMEIWLESSKSPKTSLKHAFELTRKALTIDSSSPQALSMLGWLYALAGKHEKAIAECGKAIALDPNSSIAHLWMGYALRWAGRHEEAVRFTEQALRLDPIPPSSYFRSLGIVYAFSGRYEEAISTLKKALIKSPNDVLAHISLASAYSLAGRMDEAQAEAEEVLRINPKFSVEDFSKRLKYKNKADKDRVINSLRKAGLPETPTLPLPDKPSIAVLPFVNMSGDPKQEYFSDGISEEIITALSKTPKLFVIARTSSFKYKGKKVEVRTVGRELGVRNVLEGSVRRAGDKVRITAQLVDAKTGNHLWAERYDRDLRDIFALQDEITMKILTALQVKLTEGEQARAAAKGTNNLEAYLKCLQANEYVLRLNIESNTLGKRLAKEAIALDPEYASAYFVLGRAHTLDVWLKSSKSPKDSMAKAMELVQKAIVLDDTLAEAHSLLGFLYSMTRQHDSAIAQGEKAIALNPNSAESHYGLAKILTFAGRWAESIPEYKKAIRLNPIPPNMYLWSLGLAYGWTGQYDDAITWFEKAIRQEPNSQLAHLHMAVVYSYSGRDEKARVEAAEVLRIYPKFSLEEYAKKCTYKKKADCERLLGAMRKAGLN